MQNRITRTIDIITQYSASFTSENPKGNTVLLNKFLANYDALSLLARNEIKTHLIDHQETLTQKIMDKQAQGFFITGLFSAIGIPVADALSGGSFTLARTAALMGFGLLCGGAVGLNVSPHFSPKAQQHLKEAKHLKQLINKISDCDTKTSIQPCSSIRKRR